MRAAIPGIFPLSCGVISVALAIVLAPLGFALLGLTGCSNTAYLAKEEKLYTGADVQVKAQEEVPNQDDIEDQLEGLAAPDPNAKFLGLFRLKLWLYNVGFFGKTLGEPPVLLSAVSPGRIAFRMRTLLHNKGFFDATVSYQVLQEEKTAGVQYAVTLLPPYTINSITVEGDHSPLLDSIRAAMTGTILSSGRPYDLDSLSRERARIDGALKDRGFFYFSPDFLLFEADSSIGGRKVDLYLTVKDDIPERARRIYVMGDVTVFSGYIPRRDSVNTAPPDTIRVGEYTYIDWDRKFAPEVVLRSVFFRKGQAYSRTAHDLTLNKLMNLGVFKFVNIRFDEADSATAPHLDARIFITPVLLKNIRLELQGVSKSNDLAGPVFNSSYRNRNLFRGAENFTLSLETGFETPISGTAAGLNSYEVGVRTTLELPKFITPWAIEDVSTRFVPKTRIELGARLLDRLQYFKMLSLDASFGYDWKETLTKEHVLDPVSFTLVHLAKRTPLFSALLTANPFLRRSYEEQFILGSNYTFTYNDQLESDRKNHLYFKGGIDLSGNLLYAVQSLLAGRKGSPENPFKIFGTTYSQYARFDIDLRQYYHSVDQSTAIATRLVAGVGFAYGNSSTMPYVKQFYIGGANSVRAFNARSLGPGSYKTPDSLAANGFFDEAGDIKLEANVEYRFPLVSILEGAVFLDAGNIWLARDDPTRPGATFSGRTFLDEVALGTGFGIRLDLSFFVLRLDLAFPLRIPYLPEGERWVARKIAFGDAAWRKNNLVFNIAIGYPY